jgi:phage-related tail fiber protein
MSKIALSPNASGTGTFTFASPNSNTDRTLTLPDATGTLATTADIPSLAGIVATFAMNTAPTGWLKANGAAVSRTTYATLFAAIGTTFGAGDGSTTFNLPDLRGYFSRNWDDGRGIDSGRSFGSLQETRVNNVQTVTTTAVAGSITSATINDNGTTSSPSLFTGGGTGASIAITFAKKGGDTYPGNIALLACIKF